MNKLQFWGLLEGAAGQASEPGALGIDLPMARIHDRITVEAD